MTMRTPALYTSPLTRDDVREHERRNALHLMAGLLELAGNDWSSVPDRVGEPPVRALLVGKCVRAAERGVRLTVTEGSTLHRCRERSGELVAILGNLVDNALDALRTHPPAAPDVPRVEVELREGDSLTELRVSDNGPGIPAERLQWIFTDGATTKRHTDDRHRGLGLGIVADLTRERGGTVAVTERPGGGAQFTVRLPRTDSTGERGTP